MLANRNSPHTARPVWSRGRWFIEVKTLFYFCIFLLRLSNTERRDLKPAPPPPPPTQAAIDFTSLPLSISLSTLSSVVPLLFSLCVESVSLSLPLLPCNRRLCPCLTVKSFLYKDEVPHYWAFHTGISGSSSCPSVVSLPKRLSSPFLYFNASAQSPSPS